MAARTSQSVECSVVFKRSLQTGLWDLCLATMCSLLRITNPEQVIVLVDTLIERNSGDIFRANGVSVVLIPSLNTEKIKREVKFEKRRRALKLEVYTAKKFYTWTLTQFSKLIWFDGADVLFLYNASTMLSEYEPFAAIRESSGLRCRGHPYMNNGVF